MGKGFRDEVKRLDSKQKVNAIDSIPVEQRYDLWVKQCYVVRNMMETLGKMLECPEEYKEIQATKNANAKVEPEHIFTLDTLSSFQDTSAYRLRRMEILAQLKKEVPLVTPDDCDKFLAIMDNQLIYTYCLNMILNSQKISNDNFNQNQLSQVVQGFKNRFKPKQAKPTSGDSKLIL